jgi:septal ring factor EnvC (AmiA/AmiB activator)
VEAKELEIAQIKKQLNKPTRNQGTQIDSTSSEITKLAKQLTTTQQELTISQQTNQEINQQLAKVSKSLEF